MGMTTTAVDTYVPKPGDIGLVPIHGEVGNLIRFGQWLDGDGFEKFEHAFVYLGDDLIIEAEPGGAKVTGLHYSQPEIHWCEGIAKLWDDDQRSRATRAALKYRGVPYSPMDYFALVAKRLHLAFAPGLKNYVSTSKHMICSQLADQVAYDCGVQLFDDGRWPGYVTPGSLYRRDLILRISAKE